MLRKSKALYPAIGDAPSRVPALSGESIVSQVLLRRDEQLPNTAVPRRGASTGLLRQYRACTRHWHSVKSVFCVQEPHEHAHWRPRPAGPYSYDQTELMRHGISVYNLYWADYTCPSFYRIRWILAASPCTATPGWAAPASPSPACWCSAAGSAPALAIAYLRLKRPGSVQSHAQCAGPRPGRPCGHRFSYEEHLHRQRRYCTASRPGSCAGCRAGAHSLHARLLQLSLGARFALVTETVAGRDRNRFG
uniref:Uncharacterized protein n=1 Tax=Macrostomum lignano TaxID=282301 RepID=A0A1I8FN38_9PLAT